MTDPVRLDDALSRARAELLEARIPDGHWRGELSASALSTATAITALAVVQRCSLAKPREDSGLATAVLSAASRLTASDPDLETRIASGLDWLAAHANPDGGWGDTILSVSNLSTTTLAWAAFGAVAAGEARHRPVLERAERWIIQEAGGLEAEPLAIAIIARYGKDRTFSVPILTMCALAGRLGPGRAAWRHVIPLPFELAACPHSWFAALKLPVVSYALPALIAMGLARHHHRPSLNPLARAIRSMTRGTTLRVLNAIQPANGGFLEATPLTSFVVMSLAGSGEAGHPVTRRGVNFLRASQREDGSWPIDTNLATWLTTLAVNGLGEAEAGNPKLATPIRSWLLAQQHRVEHPYTHAAPGGWAWTDLPGGVPDADDTAGALLALRGMGARDEPTRVAALAGTRWLLNLQNRDGGIPTFCRGWGALPFDRSSADITAHTIRAWLAWEDDMPGDLRQRVGSAIEGALGFLFRTQRPDGSWIPLWFGNQFAPADENGVYGTSRVLQALSLAHRCQERHPLAIITAVANAAGWLLRAQLPDGSWGASKTGPSSVEETALGVEALASLLTFPALLPAGESALVAAATLRGANWLVERVESGAWKQPAPIGFYFAKLWYFEKLYPLIFTVAALSRVTAVLPQLNRIGITT